ncbi:MAG TPA: spherulation-specific family 4 protein [Candidatus Saccharimonadales bacterium]
MTTKIRMIKRVLTSLLVALFAVAIVSPSVSAAVTNQSLAVPMYEYPTIGTYWDDITGVGGSSLPFVIVNPGSGPGAVVDSTYTAEIAENTADNIRSIGYVYTNYQARNWQDVYDDIDNWYQMYPGISGIFIDLIQEGDAADLCYVAALYNHIKNTHPDSLVVLNPGTHISIAYEPYGDIFMNAENTYAVYQSSWSIMYPGWEDNSAYQNRFWHAIHTISPSDYSAALALTRSNNAGWVYLTDDTMPNPYSATPTYWNTEVSDVGSLPASTIPNRGKTQLPGGCIDLASANSETTTKTAQKTTTTSSIRVSNTSATYPAEPAATVTFTMPEGVSLGSSTGTGWTCSPTTGKCTYDASIAASGVASVLSVAFEATCSYASGNVSAVLSNFAGNTSSFTISPTRPDGCPVASTLVNAGVATGVSSLAAMAIIVVAARVYFVRTRVCYQHCTVRRRSR